MIIVLKLLTYVWKLKNLKTVKLIIIYMKLSCLSEAKASVVFSKMKLHIPEKISS